MAFNLLTSGLKCSKIGKKQIIFRDILSSKRIDFIHYCHAQEKGVDMDMKSSRPEKSSDFFSNKNFSSLNLFISGLRSQLCLCGLLILLSINATAMTSPTAPAGAKLIKSQTTAPTPLRGFNRVGAQGWLWRDGNSSYSLVRFLCQDADSAKIVGSKYLEDLLAYGAVKQLPATEGVKGTLLQVRHGGVWLLGIDGAQVYVGTAPTLKKLRVALPGWGNSTWQKIPRLAYPRYLDNFDNAGLGIWWMPYNKTPEQLAWMKNFPAVGNLHGQSLEVTPAPNVYDVSANDNAIAQLRSIDKTYRYMLWGSGTGKTSWLNWMNLPGRQVDVRAPGFLGQDFFRGGGYKITQLASPLVNFVLIDSMQQIMKKRVDDPNLLSWMEPHGEFHFQDPTPPPPNYTTRFPAYLQLEKKYDLKTISEAYTGSRDGFKSWADVKLPDSAFFRGRRGNWIDLDEKEWLWQPGELDAGEKAGWFQPDFKPENWFSSRRDNPHLHDYTNKKTKIYPLWTRFDYDIPATFLEKNKGQKLYLHVMPFTEKKGRAVTAWVNGKCVGRDVFNPRGWKNTHSQFDITAALKPGTNQFTIFSLGGKIAYRVFLSNTPGKDFPFADNQLNRRYLDWREYVIWEKLQTLRKFLEAMRAVDPVRPIKVMTPHMFQFQAMELFERYGAYPQLTGESPGFYRPMHYKGYARLRGLPGSSEPGGPQKTATTTQMLFANIFWESQDIHDYVFDLDRDLWPYKEVVKWWSDNRTLLRTVGKTDFAKPKLGLLRDLRQDNPYATGKIWNWDISRGPLPALGLTPVLVDGRDLERGLAENVPVLIDCASTVMSDAMIDAVRHYVAGGGTFVALHNTGQHSPFSRDDWPLARSFGLKVDPKLVTKDNHHRWPLGEISFSDQQNLVPSLRGKKFKGSGVSIDYMNVARVGAVAITGSSPAKPVATWDDNTMAITEVPYGKGRFIMLGTPFFLRFKDENGKWLNNSDRQKLLEEMLLALGVKRDTGVSDERIWFEKRLSKNGLYDVYMAGGLGYRNKKWNFTDKITSNLTIQLPKDAAVIEPNAPGVPDVSATYKAGTLSLDNQEFTPYQIRQFATLRPDVGLAGPLHWLDVQRRAWRALRPVSPSLVEKYHKAAMKCAADLGEAGLDLNSDWKVRINPPADGENWITADTSSWQNGNIGSWLACGWPDATRVQYRRTVKIPQTWLKDKSRVMLGMIGHHRLGLGEKDRIWVNGKLISEKFDFKDNKLDPYFRLDVTDAIKNGQLDLALDVDSTDSRKRALGPVGTLYLRKTPAPLQVINLTGPWLKLESWQKAGNEIKLPFKGKILGLQTKVMIPKEWKGHPVRIQVDSAKPGQLGGVMINNNGYFRTTDFSPYGPRIDAWLKPGEENLIELFGTGHMKSYTFDAQLQAIRLLVYP